MICISLWLAFSIGAAEPNTLKELCTASVAQIAGNRYTALMQQNNDPHSAQNILYHELFSVLPAELAQNVQATIHTCTPLPTLNTYRSVLLNHDATLAHAFDDQGTNFFIYQPLNPHAKVEELPFEKASLMNSSAAFSSNGKWFAYYALASNKIIWWSLKDNAAMQEFCLDGRSCLSLCFIDNQLYAYTPHEIISVNENGKSTEEYIGHEAMHTALRLDANRWLIVHESRCHVYDRFKKIFSTTIPFNKSTSLIAFHADMQKIVIFDRSSKMIRVYDSGAEIEINRFAVDSVEGLWLLEPKILIAKHHAMLKMYDIFDGELVSQMHYDASDFFVHTVRQGGTMVIESSKHGYSLLNFPLFSALLKKGN